MEKLHIAEEHMANLIWEYEDLVINKPVNFGSFEHLTESQEFEIRIKHDSDEEISNAGFYISPYTEDYIGSFSPLKDYERTLWLANNYEGFGVSLRQEYTVTGKVSSHDGLRLVDFERAERSDIFTGSSIEMISGNAQAESILIDSYNPLNQVFTLANDFSVNVGGDNYRIVINKETFLKTGQGSDYNSLIPLIYKGGVIERFDSAVVVMKIRIPKFAQSAGNFLFDLNMQFTSLEDN